MRQSSSREWNLRRRRRCPTWTVPPLPPPPPPRPTYPSLRNAPQTISQSRRWFSSSRDRDSLRRARNRTHLPQASSRPDRRTGSLRLLLLFLPLDLPRFTSTEHHPLDPSIYPLRSGSFDFLLRRRDRLVERSLSSERTREVRTERTRESRRMGSRERGWRRGGSDALGGGEVRMRSSGSSFSFRFIVSLLSFSFLRFF